MSGPSMGNTLDRYLQPGVAIKKAYEILEPNLIFSEYIAGPVQEDKASFCTCMTMLAFQAIQRNRQLQDS